MAGRLWTAADMDLLAAACHHRRAAEIDWPTLAAQLDRSPSAVMQHAQKHNLYCVDNHTPADAEFIDYLLRQHARGWSDADIARGWGCQRAMVGRHRRRLKLPSNAYNARHSAKLAPTQFKPGRLYGHAARMYRGLGSIIIRTRQGRGGYQQRVIKVRDEGPPQHRYIPYARYLWEQAHGPVPAGCHVRHANGDTLDDRLANLVLMTRSEQLAWLRQVHPEAEAKRRRRQGAARTERARVRRRAKIVRAESLAALRRGEITPEGRHRKGSRACG